jgi:hypothetical protein
MVKDSYFLLEIVESALGHDFTVRFLIREKGRQHVKYQYHRTLKDWGYRNADWGDKHALSRDGIASEIYSIRSLSRAEYQFLDEFLPKWTKV